LFNATEDELRIIFLDRESLHLILTEGVYEPLRCFDGKFVLRFHGGKRLVMKFYVGVLPK